MGSTAAISDPNMKQSTKGREVWKPILPTMKRSTARARALRAVPMTAKSTMVQKLRKKLI